MEYLNDVEQALVKTSFALVAANVDELVDVFYAHLFASDPSLRPLFSDDLTQQKMKLQKLLTTIIGLLGKPDVLMQATEELGKRHVAYGVKTRDFDTVGGALIFAIQNAAGDAFTAEVESSWTKLYTILSQRMIAQFPKEA